MDTTGTAIFTRSIRHQMAMVDEAVRSSHQSCKRKTVCSIVCHCLGSYEVTPICCNVNGPNRGHECSNIVGGCGCAHSEPRNTMDAIKKGWRHSLILCINYSPCSFCANVIVDSGLYDAVVYDITTEHDKRGLEILQHRCKVWKRSEIDAVDRSFTGERIVGASIVMDLRDSINDQLTIWTSRRNSLGTSEFPQREAALS